MKVVISALALLLIAGVGAIGIPLHDGARCMLIQGELDVHQS